MAAQQSDVQQILGDLPVASANVEVIAAPLREVPASLLRPIIRAMAESRRIDVDYVSLNNPDREGRIIVPHTLVWTGYRWHVRAWCEKNRDYRDFVLSRFRGDADLMDASDHTEADDQAWHTHVTLEITPDNRLTPDQQGGHCSRLWNDQRPIEAHRSREISTLPASTPESQRGQATRGRPRSANCAGKLRRDKPVAHLTIPIQHVVL